MFTYYFRLGLRSLRRNIVLTALMIVAIGVGIGASMTTLTVFRAMSGDPIPQKSTQLYAPQIDNWGPDKHAGGLCRPFGAAAELYRRDGIDEGPRRQTSIRHVRIAAVAAASGS